MKKQKEVAINKCFGGFGLSDEALELLYKKKGMKWVEKDNCGIGSSTYYSIPKDEYDKISRECHKRDGDYREVNGKGYILDSGRDFDRDDPILIEVIKKMGEKANGMCAKIKIIKIPFDIDFEIDEYDGMESIHETHRSWA